MTSLVATLDDAVRAVVVRRLRRLDQWSVIKLVLGLLGAARAYRRLRQIMRTTGLRRWAFTTAMPLLKQLPPVRKELEEGQAKVRADLEGVLFRDLTAPRLELPAKGTPQAETCSAWLREQIHGDGQPLTEPPEWFNRDGAPNPAACLAAQLGPY